MNKNKALETVSGQSPATPKQLKLDLGIEVERVVGGIEMGVLENGIPYLTQRGLAEMTGAARRSIQEITEEWQEAQTTDVWRGRMLYFRDYLSKADFDEPRLFIEITKDGSPHYAYPDMVCMAMVEYFAFEAQRTNETAITNFRNLARYGLQKFIYDALGYVPEDPWKLFNARVSLLKDSVPAGYFSVFKESTGLVVDLINAGLPVNQHTIPDGSVGGTWGRHWTAQNLAAKYGERIEYPHYYPPEYPQSASNPQKANAYPNQAWPEFQDWFRSVYLRTKYPPYILKKAKMLSGGADEARQLAAMYEQKAIEG
ncbi:hypothetical protein FEV51_08305 [Qipengyuania marisflavi]|uniref:BstA-like C-terminal domain-containing protein n=1 Tax=Qipengyuania marisflavi TaxID=2486356 RepID=A0A5S3P899_9SPHN|nr:hypothetical protein FEV51_08305 [Qipengyuania marisflavi]